MLDQLLSKSPALQAFFQELTRSHSLLLEGLWDAPKALLALLVQKATGKNVLIVSGKREDALLNDFPFFQGKEILDFLPWEILPSEEVPPSLDITGKRIEILHKIFQSTEPFLLHCPIQALSQKVLSPKTLIPLCEWWKQGDETSFHLIPAKLTQLGYQRKPVASDKGEFAVRGGIIDLFPPSSSAPYRLEFFGDILESIRIYDPVGQKTICKVKEFFLCPASEWHFLKQEKKAATLLDYLGSNLAIILDDLLAIEDEYVAFQSLPGFHQSRFLFPLDEFLQILPRFTHLFWMRQAAEELSQDVQLKKKKGRAFYSRTSPFQPLSFEFFHQTFSSQRFNHPFVEIGSFFSPLENKESYTSEELLEGVCRQSIEVQFLTQSISEEKMLKRKIEELHLTLPPSTSFQSGYLSSGFVLPEEKFALFPTTELTQRRKVRRQAWRNSYHHTEPDSLQLFPGDIVVHFHHGIGKFLGIEKLPNNQGKPTEFLQIEYAQQNKLYVPLSQSYLITRYVGSKEEGALTFNALGSSRWQRTCHKTQASILGYAKELLDRAAQRAIHESCCYPEDSLDMQLFEEEFPFPETEDQIKAIQAFKQDMQSPKAMDRLICGDVGYGKTEVAMRAAFKAAYDGKKQVAVLVPTTVLALQHFETFSARMANFPLRIAILSRFSSIKETKETLKRVQIGEVDILIGTHRLLSKDVAFHNLGLLIVDEEQRFGVRAKEHLKALKCGVDCLTLSATPIPRTLYMSLIGIRDVSTINTPPQDRLPIKTILTERNSEVIKNALLREFSRDGQAFFIHNRIETLPKIQMEIEKLLPEARILSGHGRMDPEEIDAVFHAFKQGESDLLISTTIVENGIDIPNANTILIDRADQFGMADLYQLRGRVGRWNRPSYAYFLVPNLQMLPEVARKRLQALVEASGYGGGLKIAMKDLEIRGAGDILGEDQSGQVSAVGFHLYCKLLKRAINALTKETPLHFIETKMEYTLDARIPEEYIDESDLRLEIYYRLGNISSPQETYDLFAEMEDRFGPAPQEVILLCLLTRLRLEASYLNILNIKLDKATIKLEKQQGTKTIQATVLQPSLKHLGLFEQEMRKILQHFAAAPTQQKV